ncbi:MAG: FAD-dependent oxidoreductase [Myxococcota bacterium]
MGRKRVSEGRSAARRECDISQWHGDADVVVVGLGAAGACAAIEAAEAGADVLVLERASGGGGTSAMSTGQIYLGGGTRIQKACGFEDSADAMYDYLLASSGPGPDAAKLRLFCDHSVSHFDWLEAEGVPFKESFYGEGSYTPTDDCLSYSGSELAHPYPDVAPPAPRGHTVQQEGIEAGVQLMKSLVAAVERTAARIAPDHRCEALVRDGADRVVGVVTRHLGEERCYRARGGVILCAGGFIRNREMVLRHAPWLARVRWAMGTDGDDGRGIRMGTAAGGEAIRMHTGCIVLPFTVPKGLLRGLMVNRSGQRFINEDAYQTVVGEAALVHQQGEVYLVVDDAIFETPMPPVEIKAVGESIEELERELGMPEGSLQHTVARYNAGAEHGIDPSFHKAKEHLQPLGTPPYAALDYRVDHSLWSVFTLGGLHTDTDGRVLSPEDDPIPGLFAAGRTTSGLAAQGYSSGLSIADATFFGRRAGRAAATLPR